MGRQGRQGSQAEGDTEATEGDGESHRETRERGIQGRTSRGRQSETEKKQRETEGAMIST